MNTSDRLATISLCLSVATASFTFYQWKNTERESRIGAAMELSKNYYKEVDASTWKILTSIRAGNASLSQNDYASLARQADRIEYIALLVNTGRLDREYLSRVVACDIVFTKTALDKLNHPAMTPGQRPHMNKLADEFLC